MAATRPDRPLAGRSILVTRPAGRGASLVARLRELGADAESRPTIELLPPPDLAPCRAALARLADYEWVVFTSPNGVRFFLDAAGAGAGRTQRIAGAVAAVGPGTARALKRAGLEPAVVASDSRAEGLAAALRGRITRGRPVLLVRPEQTRPVLERALRDLGAEVDAVAFYRNAPAPGVAAVARDVRDGRFDLVVFTSPSTAIRLVEASPDGARTTREALGRIEIVAIGPVTAAALSDLGLPVSRVADEASDEGLVGAIVSLCYHPVPFERRSRRPVRRARLPPSGIDSEVPLSVDDVMKTPLHAVHVAAGARMVDFSGWSMPVQYTGVIDEHLAVRKRAGLFDVSHMGEVDVRGPQAEAFLQHITCNDVARLNSGRAQYNALTMPNGAFVDDLLIYKLADNEYLLVVNAGNTPKDFGWLQKHAEGYDVRLENTSANWAQLALQGPRALEILDPLTPAALEAMKYYRFAVTEVEGAHCIVSRTGYTGEDGFEVYAPAAEAERLWYSILTAGAPHGLIPVGLGARDTLRLEAKMALYGNDIDDTTSVLEADLGWIVKLGKGEFIGREALVRQSEEGVRRILVGFEMKGRAIARHGYRALQDGKEVGRVTSGSFAPFLEKNIGLAYLPVELAGPGSEFEVEIRRRHEPAEVVPTPFYKRPR